MKHSIAVFATLLIMIEPVEAAPRVTEAENHCAWAASLLLKGFSSDYERKLFQASARGCKQDKEACLFAQDRIEGGGKSKSELPCE